MAAVDQVGHRAGNLLHLHPLGAVLCAWPVGWGGVEQGCPTQRAKGFEHEGEPLAHPLAYYKVQARGNVWAASCLRLFNSPMMVSAVGHARRQDMPGGAPTLSQPGTTCSTSRRAAVGSFSTRSASKSSARPLACGLHSCIAAERFET